MLLNTRGIVISSVKYSDTSLIVKIFTEEEGVMSYIVKGVRSKKGEMKAALFRPLQLLEMSVYARENKQLNHIKEISVSHGYSCIYDDAVKRSVVIFLDEVLNRSLKDRFPDKEFFNWLWQSLIWYDLSKENTANFHLFFLIRLSKFLGFFPKSPSVNRFRYFDMVEGVFTNNEPLHPNYVTGKTAELFRKLVDVASGNTSGFKITASERSDVLDVLMRYYRLQIEHFGEIKSLEILRMIF